MIDGDTRILGVIGDPIGQSLSPAIQNAALKHYGMNYLYLAFPVSTDQVKGVIQSVRLFQMPGLNVTAPHKERVLPLMNELSETARRLGAVNTVVRREGKLIGENTDYDGFAHALQRMRNRKRMRTAILFGAGGASRAVLAVLLDQKFDEVILACRKPARGRKTIAQLKAASAVRVVPWDQRERVQADLLVNATPLGQRARDPLPATARVTRHAKGVMDLVARPGGTRWTALARSYGIPAQEGSEMLIAQGRESFRLWFGKTPPFGVMQEALAAAAGRCA
ncbi:MAG: shikimate dehydrogenase [Candidatus Eisenbacteria bacterium]|nr:shikimate dehydrogenase [Candidatus Eisenbacteria bacterium]